MEKKNNLKIIFLHLRRQSHNNQLEQGMKTFLHKVFDLYYDGFTNMRLGRTLWTVIIVKVAIIFVVLKLFFFPDFVKQNASPGQEADYVSRQLTER